MKKIIGIFILTILHLICLAQSEFDDYNSYSSESGMQEPARDSIPQENIPHYRYTWKWMRNGVYSQEILLDTLQDGIHNFNDIFKRSISNTYLGNFPSPYESNIFIERNEIEDFYPLTYLRSFLFMPEDLVHFNTTTPYTRLKYFTGGGKGKAENMIDVWHSQNINPFWNIGARYHLISSDGRYANQKSKISNFSLFSSYEHNRITTSFMFDQHKGEIRENGGIQDRSYVTDSTEKAENIQTWLGQDEVYNTFRIINFNLQGQYNIGKPKQVINGKDTTELYPAKAVLNIRTQNNRHKFEEESINFGFYRHTYIDSTQTSDHYKSRMIDISAKFIVNEHPKYKYLPGIYTGLDFKKDKYDQQVDFDTITRNTKSGSKNYMGTYITAGIFNMDTNAMLNYDIAGRIGIIGYYAGNFKVDGFISQALNRNKNSLLKADVKIELQSVNPFLNFYIGNHNIWDNDFKAVKTINLEGRYINKRLRTELGIGFTNIFSHVYFDSTIMPQQTGKTLIILSAWAKEVFRTGHFYFDQSVYFQKSTQEDILSLPAIALYSHNYYQNYLFKNALQLQIGFDLYYNTGFYADNYAPAIMQFHNQREHKTGNYPKADVFLNLKIKRAHIFVKYEHVNFHIKQHGNFFSAADYPINPAMLKFGIQWDFFD